MTDAMNEETTVITRIFDEILNQKRIDLVDELFAEDCIEHDPLRGALHGREAFKKSLQEWFNAFPDMTNTVSDIARDGDMAYWTVRFVGTHTGELNGIPATGKKVDIVGINKGTLKDGQAYEHWTGNDILQFMGQLGLMPQMDTGESL